MFDVTKKFTVVLSLGMWSRPFGLRRQVDARFEFRRQTEGRIRMELEETVPVDVAMTRAADVLE